MNAVDRDPTQISIGNGHFMKLRLYVKHVSIFFRKHMQGFMYMRLTYKPFLMGEATTLTCLIWGAGARLSSLQPRLEIYKICGLKHGDYRSFQFLL